MRTIAILAVALLAACSVNQEPDGDVDVDGIRGDIEQWRGSLSARGGSGIRGAVTARTAWLQGGPGSTGADIEISGATSGAQHPWHIHSGTCGSGGPIIGAASAYPVLTVDASGNATARAVIGVGLNPDLSYHVNVHRSPTDPGTIVACGEIDD